MYLVLQRRCCHGSKKTNLLFADVRRHLLLEPFFFLSLLTIATASGFAGYLIGVNLCWRSIFNKEDIVYLLLGYGLKHFVKGRVYVVCPDDRTF